MHGPGGKDTVADGFRLWTLKSTTVPNQTAPSCVRICAADANCTGVTFSMAAAFGLHSCYLISPPIVRVTEETPFASWTKHPTLPPTPTPGSGNTPLGPRAGRVSDPILPYFAVAGKSRALVASVAWSGWWRGETDWDAAKGVVSVRVGHSHEHLCTTLHPGEEIRTLGVATVEVSASELTTRITASIKTALDPAAGVARTGFNRHRQLLLRHRLPRDPRDGKIKGSVVASWSWLNWPDSSRPAETTQLWHIAAVKNTSVEYYWLDAGYFKGGFPNGVGNWQVPLPDVINATLYPNRSIAVLGERAHASPNPVGFITWFEPERVAAGTYIARTFPEYVLKTGDGGGGDGGLLNLGDPDANGYIHGYLDAVVTEYGLDVLRIDYNIDLGV